MATTAVAANKVKVYWLNRKPIPAGWVVDGNGQPVTDSTQAMEYLFGDAKQGGITPLGGTREIGSHKSYGLATMVHILGGVLSGASFSPIRNRTQKVGDPNNLGHFFLAIDPKAFRDEGVFERDLDEVVDVLHNAKRADPDQPVLIAGDPENATRAERLSSGQARRHDAQHARPHVRLQCRQRHHRHGGDAARGRQVPLMAGGCVESISCSGTSRSRGRARC